MKNLPLIFGIIIMTIAQLVRHTLNIENFGLDFLMGAGIGLEIVGLICINHGDKIKNLKKKLFFK